MNERNLPPLPQSCEAVRLYLAVWDDLSPEQRRAASAHIQTCANCAAEQQVMSQASRLVSTLEASSPSPRVDAAVMAAIAAYNNGSNRNRQRLVRLKEKPTFRPSRFRGTPLRLAGLVAAAAVILLALLTTTTISQVFSPKKAFALPATLSWNAYVLYHTQTEVDFKGEKYSITAYHDLATGHLNVETVQDGVLDVDMVSDGHDMLGMDMMHHVAQWDAKSWGVDASSESVFNLSELRNDLRSGRATYLDEDTFRGQTVYRIRCENGLVLLLDMNYRPVNVLRGAVGPGTGEPMYDTLQFMPPSHVDQSMWEMQVPNGFKMGTLPKKP